MNDMLAQKWVSSSGDVGIKRTAAGLRLTNRGSAEQTVRGSAVRLPGSQARVRFSGTVGRGSAVVVRLLDGRNRCLAETTLDSDAYVDIGDVRLVYPQLVISAQTDVTVTELSARPASQTESSAAFLLEALTSDVLVITPSYPTPENKYLAGFVHSRLVAYQNAGLSFDVVCAHAYPNSSHYSFEGIAVTRTSFDGLREILQRRHYKKILVHFFDGLYARVFDACDLGDAQLLLWVHGPETLYWDWPVFTTPYFSQRSELTTDQKRLFETNDAMIRRYDAKPNVTWIFVSDWIKRRSQELTGVDFARSHVIPNFIDPAVFRYQRKDPALRRRIFFVRRFDDVDKYAIDVNVRTILELSRRPGFGELEFDVFGTGAVHEKLVAPLREFGNVHIHPHFLTHSQIAEAHRTSGIGLFATRYDAQGVSMCEAAMSGLAIVSSQNDAIAEFMPADQGILAPTEDPVAYADIIAGLVDDPQRFEAVAAACHDKVAALCDAPSTTDRELALITGPSPVPEPVRIARVEAPLLTVVVPAYNVARFLPGTVASLMDQRNAHLLQVIIVNDGSTDGTPDVARALMRRYNDPVHPVIDLIDKANGGHGSTINVGLAAARGRYFRVLDGDDWVASEALSELLDRLRDESSSVVLTDYAEDRVGLDDLAPVRLYPFMAPGQTYHFDDLCYPGYGFVTWGPILATGNFRTDLLRSGDFHLSEKSFYVDIEFDIYSILNADTVVYYPLDIYRYYMGRTGQSISRESFIAHRDQHERILLGLLAFLASQPGISAMKRSYIRDKILAPMADSQYLILVRWLRSRSEFRRFDAALRAYPEIYAHPEVAKRLVRMLRKTDGVGLDRLVDLANAREMAATRAAEWYTSGREWVRRHAR